VTTAIPSQVVNARRAAGVILILSALTAAITVVALIAWWWTQPPSVAAMPGATAPTITTPVSAPPTIQQPVSYQEALQRQVDADHQQVEALVGHWIPQLSSKTVGTRADGIVYSYAEILAHFNGLKARYPRALLLSSNDYTSFDLSNYWVVVIPITYDNGAAANSWCDTEGIDRDNCFAKLLRHAGGSQGTTLLRK
jgi:hypothetical protein